MRHRADARHDCLFSHSPGWRGRRLQPSEQAILADTFPREKFRHGVRDLRDDGVVAPAIGPTLGGWITDNFTWRWIFFINCRSEVWLCCLSIAWLRIRRIEREAREKRGDQDRLHGTSHWSHSASAAFRSCSTKDRKTTGSALADH